MRVEDLPISGGVKSKLMEHGISQLYPPQAEAIKAGALDGESILLATSTASGKTLIAVLAAARMVEEGLKTIYLSPLRALTTEKAGYFKELLEPLDVKVAAVSRDYDSPEEWLRKVDVVVATYEKADSMVRHRASWLKDIGLIVVDEVHLLSDPERGPRLETAATALMKIAPGAQRLGLSATITNYEEVSAWMRAKPVVSDWRPVQLNETIYYDGRLYSINEDGLRSEEVNVSGNPLIGLTVNCILEGGQVMVFASSRRRAESYAVKISRSVGELSVLDRDGLRSDAEHIRAEGRGLEMAELLASCVERGVAFHHAGLTHAHRRIVERSFHERRLKVICATPTLAAGVNIPARMVLIPDARKSRRPLSVMEYKQLVGRAGRPGLDPYGVSVLIAGSKRRLNHYVKKYLRSEPEPVTSALGGRKPWAVLAAASSGIARDLRSLEEFLSSTLYHIQYGSIDVLGEVRWLNILGLMRLDGDRIKLTRLGRRVAELCIEPTTVVIAKNLARAPLIDENTALLAVSASEDVPPISCEVPLTAAEEFSEALGIVGNLGGRESEALAKAFALKLWVNEISEQRLANVHGVAPGDMLVLREAAEWISSALSELLAVLGKPIHSAALMEMSERIRHGVRRELLQLCSIEGVGRVRARMLYNAGFKTIEDLARASVEELSRVHGISSDLAAKIKLSAKRILGEVVEA